MAMKTKKSTTVTINYNGQAVVVKLTPSQLTEIERQLAAPALESKVYNHFTDIKTFEDACAFLGIDPQEFHKLHKNLFPDTYVFEQLKVINKALNGGQHIDYSDTNVVKYYPWFHAIGSSRGFKYGGYIREAANSDFSSRLLYKSREICEYAGQQFVNFYNAYINL